MCRGTYPLTPPLPFTSGQEATGIVTAVGEGVDLPIGTRIMCVTAFTEGSGSFAEECLVLAESAFAVPDGLTDAEAAGFWIPHLTGWLGLVDRGRLAAGEWLAVLGAGGGSGIAAVQLGHALGARVIAIVGDEERAAFCRSLGAEETLNHRDGPLAPALGQITAGHGVDVIYDPVGGSSAEDVAGALARFGRWLAVGFASGAWPVAQTHQLVWANASLMGVLAAGNTRAELDEIHARLSGMIGEGRLRNAVTEQVPFDDLPGALQRMADRRVVGKMVMVP
jgi:NADPH2:quinone reductase